MPVQKVQGDRTAVKRVLAKSTSWDLTEHLPLPYASHAQNSSYGKFDPARGKLLSHQT